RRKIERAIQLEQRLAVVVLLVEPPTTLEVELRRLLLIALPAGRQPRLDLAGARQFDLGLHPFESARDTLDRVGGRPFPAERRVLGRQSAGQVPLARGFAGAAGRRQRSP